jgi:hypothetical protein
MAPNYPGPYLPQKGLSGLSSAPMELKQLLARLFSPVDVQMCVLGALAIICFLVAYLREAIQAFAEREGWIVTVALILLTLPIIVMGFVGLVTVMWAYGIPFYVAVK